MFLKILRALAPLCVLASCVWAGMWLIWNPPEQVTMEVKPPLIQVKGMVLRKSEHAVVVRSQGMVQPRTRGTLHSEVSGRVVEVAPNFDEGGFFDAGEILVKVDPTDYETALVVAKAAEAEARTQLAEEQAKAEQALEDWKSLGKTIPATDLALRKPQVAQAKATLEARTAEVKMAQRNLERTVIRAPYAGQVLEQAADVGQYISPGGALGKIFAVDYFEVRLPLPERDLRFLHLPENWRDGTAATPLHVALRSVMAGRILRWDAEIIRMESAIDESTRQWVAVARIADPCRRRADGGPSLKIGQFVEADIVGEKVKDVFVIPRSVVRAGNEIILITPEDTLRRVRVEQLTADDKKVVIAAGTKNGPAEGDRLCLTPIPFPADGAKVLPVMEPPPEDKPAAKVAGPAGVKAPTQAALE